MAMPWGKYRGHPIREVPSGYLVWILEQTTIEEPLSRGIRDELAWRLGLQRSTLAPSWAAPMTLPGELASELRAMLAEGYRALALKRHPDRGGDGEAMRRVNAARDWCRGWGWL
jgi:L-alanine-DL-glutamate epimerase-like enolase superfamily enzyme